MNKSIAALAAALKKGFWPAFDRRLLEELRKVDPEMAKKWEEHHQRTGK